MGVPGSVQVFPAGAVRKYSCRMELFRTGWGGNSALKSRLKKKTVLAVILAFACGCTSQNTQKTERAEQTAENTSQTAVTEEPEEIHTEERIPMEPVSVHMPEEYYIEMTVKNSSGFGSQTAVYALSEKDGWYYIKQGYDREQYVFEPVSENRYISWKYDERKGTYTATMISDALRQQIDAGNVPLDSVTVGREQIDSMLTVMDTYFFGYRTLTDALYCDGEETVLGRECQKVSGSVNALVKSDFIFWIDEETGLVMRSANMTKTGPLETEQFSEMTVFSQEGQVPEAGW